MENIDSDLIAPQNYDSDKFNKKLVIIAIIPAFNESQKITEIITQTGKYVNSILVIDDGSSDETVNIVASKNTGAATILRNIKNTGKGESLKRGLIESLKYDPDIVVTLDADGQHDPNDIPKLVAVITNHQADIAIGSRYNDLGEIPVIRRSGILLINFINRVLIINNVKDSLCGFRAYSKDVIRTITSSHSKGFGAEIEQLAIAKAHGFRIAEVPIQVRYTGLNNTSKKNSFLQGAEIISTIFRIALHKKKITCLV